MKPEPRPPIYTGIRTPPPLRFLVVIGGGKTEGCDQSSQPLQDEEQLFQSEEADYDEDEDRVVADQCHDKVSAIHGVLRADQRRGRPWEA
jgi:hypothetical protein